MDIKTWRGGNDAAAEAREDMLARAMGPLPYRGNISPRVYLVGQVLAAMIPMIRNEDWHSGDVAKLFGQIAVRIADATLDAMQWPSGKPEEKR